MRALLIVAVLLLITDADPRNQLLTIHELAAYLNVPIGPIYEWNRKGTGPKRLKAGQALRYRRRDVDAWLERRPS